MWLTNTKGKKDAMLTFATISFGVVTANLLLSTFTGLNIGDFSVEFQSLDTGVMGTYLGATFKAYVSRRWTDEKYSEGE